jgi:hypothetical protein
MTPAFTVRAFGAYLVVLGTGVLLVPALLLTPFGFEPPRDIWVRVVGLLAALIGLYYWRAGGANLRAFFPWTVQARLTVLAVFLVFVALDLAPPILILFGAIDAAGALWTWRALHNERTSAT